MLVAVDSGADALMEAGYRPNLIIGDMDSVSDEALEAGAELVVHAYPDGRAPGMSRIRNLGLDAVPLPARHQRGRGAAGRRRLRRQPDRGRRQPLNVEEFLDKGRPGMASTFLTHLRVGGKIVNARGAHQLYQSRISGWGWSAGPRRRLHDLDRDRLLARLPVLGD